MDSDDILEIMVRSLVLFVIYLGLALWDLEAGIYTPVIRGLFFFGAVAIVIGPMATGSGFRAGWGYYIDRETPGCAWYALGIIMWVIAVGLLVSSCRGG